MKTAKEFFDRLRDDEAFAKDVAEAVQAKRDAGAKSYYETFIPVAESKGYSVSEKDLDAVFEERANDLTEDELGKVAGGTSCGVISSVILISTATIGISAISVKTTE